VEEGGGREWRPRMDTLDSGHLVLRAYSAPSLLTQYLGYKYFAPESLRGKRFTALLVSDLFASICGLFGVDDGAAHVAGFDGLVHEVVEI
jgi:hypothetical protein